MAEKVSGGVNKGRRNGSEWWDKSLRVSVRKKSGPMKEKQNGSEKNGMKYRERSRIEKGRVTQCKLRADEKWVMKVSENDKGNISCFRMR